MAAHHSELNLPKSAAVSKLTLSPGTGVPTLKLPTTQSWIALSSCANFAFTALSSSPESSVEGPSAKPACPPGLSEKPFCSAVTVFACGSEASEYVWRAGRALLERLHRRRSRKPIARSARTRSPARTPTAAVRPVLLDFESAVGTGAEVCGA